MSYDSNIRQGEPGEDDIKIEKIEVDFAIPAFISGEQMHRLANLIEEIARAPKNTPVNGVHWQSGSGSKPQWSQFDAGFLGKKVDPKAPATGEPTFDDSILYFETSAREK